MSSPFGIVRQNSVKDKPAFTKFNAFKQIYGRNYRINGILPRGSVSLETADLIAIANTLSTVTSGLTSAGVLACTALGVFASVFDALAFETAKDGIVVVELTRRFCGRGRPRSV